MKISEGNFYFLSLKRKKNAFVGILDIEKEEIKDKRRKNWIFKVI
jgi:hypothetical protein